MKMADSVAEGVCGALEKVWAESMGGMAGMAAGMHAILSRLTRNSRF